MTLDSRWIGIMLLTVGACGLLAADVGAPCAALITQRRSRTCPPPPLP